MVKHGEKLQSTEHPDDAIESMRLLAIEDIARQIAVLVVRQHRRLHTAGGKKSNEPAL